MSTRSTGLRVEHCSFTCELVNEGTQVAQEYLGNKLSYYRLRENNEDYSQKTLAKLVVRYWVVRRTNVSNCIMRRNYYRVSNAS